MEVNIYDEFLSPLEILYITGYLQPKRQMQRLNQLGITFIPPNGNTKHPIVRRDYSNKKAHKSRVASEQKARVVWRSNVLNQGG
ncbi:DUF4224 domain-containing protein [Pasteurella multocida]|uniref:DUF4224 domain-containing protein n=1 Tax=Pasteurella multocida TaxID=747 RepID=UPI0029475672|nr:DUF4224 domain-containing protein [Pasteurella multocida]MEE3748087.1 DUF4224 domain-containing protein [Pasteurella multocida]HDR0998459.1 DUF4224 domain-containing protein [Pasteurella multocida]HDR1016106.1 DUF4224 domain-containing protein [Pasteurella multocida]HDR1018116.1 DUF4224 domain-containing protein [Pasteurella multocida]